MRQHLRRSRTRTYSIHPRRAIAVPTSTSWCSSQSANSQRLFSRALRSPCPYFRSLRTITTADAGLRFTAAQGSNATSEARQECSVNFSRNHTGSFLGDALLTFWPAASMRACHARQAARTRGVLVGARDVGAPSRQPHQTGLDQLQVSEELGDLLA